MTFKELRSYMRNRHRKQQIIRWNKSGIVEVAEIMDTGAIIIINVVTKKSYKIPHHYKDIDITLVEPTEDITFGSLIPKTLR